jgi:hypothetical protein
MIRPAAWFGRQLKSARDIRRVLFLYSLKQSRKKIRTIAAERFEGDGLAVLSQLLALGE